MSEAKATARPWKIDERNGCIAIYEADKEFNCLDVPVQNFIAYFSGYQGDVNQWQVRDKDKANAAFIVEAINAHDSLLARNKKLTEALEEIADPIGYMQRKLKPGERLNGLIAVQLSNDTSYLRGTAKAALAEDKEQTHNEN